MAKLLIVNNNLHIGGVQKALVNLLWNIRDRYEITLLLFSRSGELLEELPPDIRVICPSGAWRYLGMTRDDVHSLRDRIGRAFFAAITRVFGRKYAVSLMSLGQRKYAGYDAAISYLHNSGDKVFYGGCNDFVLKHVRANRKITFLHCDYLHCGADTPDNGRQYAKFDTIAACSQGCADAFLKAHPVLKEKVCVVRNCHRFDQIREAAQADPQTLKAGKVNIVTVARLGKEKGVERALRVIAQLGPLRERMHYYVIGDGVQRKLLQQIIREENISEIVTLCGQKQNPYGYIKAADLLLIPSYSEAAPLVIGEAASLGTPVLSTETSSAREMIEETGYGWVCKNTESDMRGALWEMIGNQNDLETQRHALLQLCSDNTKALRDFYACIENRCHGAMKE